MRHKNKGPKTPKQIFHFIKDARAASGLEPLTREQKNEYLKILRAYDDECLELVDSELKGCPTDQPWRIVRTGFHVASLPLVEGDALRIEELCKRHDLVSP